MERNVLRKRSGMSLIEIIVAITLVAVMSSMLFLIVTRENYRAGDLSEMEFLDSLVSAIQTADRQGGNVVIRNVVLPSGASASAITGNSRMNRADGMFVSGQEAVEKLLGRSLRDLSDLYRFGRQTTTLTGTGTRGNVTLDSLVVWIYGTNYAVGITDRYGENYDLRYQKRIETTKADKTDNSAFTILRKKIRWEKWN